MHDPRKLPSLLVALVPLGLSQTGCGSDIGDFESTICLMEPGGLDDLSPVAGVDYVALRSASDLDQEPDPATVASWGVACGGATDKAGCTAALGSLPQNVLVRESSQYSVDYDLAVTQGDLVHSVGSRQALLDLLGDIDTPAEAALVAFAAGHRVVCGEANVRKNGSSYVLLGGRGSGCGEGDDVERYEITVTSSGELTEGPTEVIETGDPNCAIGRRPQALRSRVAKGRTVGQFFAHAAHLEAASVPAFEQLAVELCLHGAPRSLRRATLAARSDEIRHAALTMRLSRRFGGRPSAPTLGRRQVRDLVSMAIDNAMEGCVRETYGALVASVQAARARGPALRRALGAIARDETRHAALSYAIDAWLGSKLTARERRRVDEAKRIAAAALVDGIAPWSRSVEAITGMPDAEHGVRLARGLLRGVGLAA